VICNRAGVQIFLGTLREAEVERINDRISQAVMETCLAMTIFREEFNVEFVAMFTILTFVKVFHWLVQDRVDYIETVPTVSRLHHLRILTFMALLLVCPSPGCQPVTPVPPAHVHLPAFPLLCAFTSVLQLPKTECTGQPGCGMPAHCLCTLNSMRPCCLAPLSYHGLPPKLPAAFLAHAILASQPRSSCGCTRQAVDNALPAVHGCADAATPCHCHLLLAAGHRLRHLEVHI